MVGARRPFVHADESIQRLPEVVLPATLCVLTATAPLAPPVAGIVIPNTSGRFRRMAAGKPFLQLYPLPGQLRKKRLPRTFARGEPRSKAKITSIRTICGVVKRRNGLNWCVRSGVSLCSTVHPLLAETKCKNFA